MNWYKKSQEEFGGEIPGGLPRINPNYKIKDAVKSEDDAARFLTELVFYFPFYFSKALGFSESEIVKRVKDSLLAESVKDLRPGISDKFKKYIESIKTYNDAINFLKNTISPVVNQPHVFKEIIFPALKLNGADAIKRLYNYVPLLGADVGEIVEEKPSQQKRVIDDILDNYNAGKINKEEMQRMLREFARNIGWHKISKLINKEKWTNTDSQKSLYVKCQSCDRWATSLDNAPSENYVWKSLAEMDAEEKAEMKKVKAARVSHGICNKCLEEIYKSIKIPMHRPV